MAKFEGETVGKQPARVRGEASSSLRCVSPPYTSYAQPHNITQTAHLTIQTQARTDSKLGWSRRLSCNCRWIAVSVRIVQQSGWFACQVWLGVVECDECGVYGECGECMVSVVVSVCVSIRRLTPSRGRAARERRRPVHAQVSRVHAQDLNACMYAW